MSDRRGRTRDVETELIARLKRVRKAAALTQVELAERMGLYGGPVISAIEKQQRGISLGEFVLWCQACGVSPSTVISGEPMTIQIAEPA